MQPRLSPSVRAQVQRLGATVTEVRSGIRWSQRELSRRSGVSQSMISRVERARLEDPPLATVALLIEVMGGRIRLEVESPFLGDRRRQLDPAHACMSGYIGRRLAAKGWIVATEVEVGENRARGWIDLLAFNPTLRHLLVIEIKTEIHDLGRIDRTLGSYERASWIAARRLGWRPATVAGCLVLLMTQANDKAVRFNRDSLDGSYPIRALSLSALVEGVEPTTVRNARALVMVDPRSMRRSWIRPTTVDGRRSPAPYIDYADFMRRTRNR